MGSARSPWIEEFQIVSSWLPVVGEHQVTLVVVAALLRCSYPSTTAKEDALLTICSVVTVTKVYAYDACTLCTQCCDPLLYGQEASPSISHSHMGMKRPKSTRACSSLHGHGIECVRSMIKLRLRPSYSNLKTHEWRW